MRRTHERHPYDTFQILVTAIVEDAHYQQWILDETTAAVAEADDARWRLFREHLVRYQ